jgi:aquaporin Z
MEAAELGLFMISACLFVVLLEHPASPVATLIASTTIRRALVGAAMGLTAVAIVYSPFGKRSGAHFNPAVTLTFFRLGKVDPWDAAFYVAAQFAGGIAGVALAAVTFPQLVGHPSVNYVVTVPGENGPEVAFFAEALISFLLMTVILIVSNLERMARYTGVFAGILVATYITIEAPLSGMSMNPARTLGSAFGAQAWTSLWVYFTAPPLGMLLAAELHLWLEGRGAVECAKLHHQNDTRCIFCEYQEARQPPADEPVLLAAAVASASGRRE